MRLNNPQQAIVEPAKVRDYLLAPDHPVGRSKAVVLEAVGYRRDSWQELHEALCRVADSDSARLVAVNDYGRKYLIPVMLMGPLGRVLPVRTIWIVRRGEDFPRFVTLYPGEWP